MLQLLAQHKKVLFACFLSAVIYLYIGYFLDRSHFYELLACFTICFGSYFFITNNSKSIKSLSLFLGVGIFFRVLFLTSIPTLSDDYFRFIWDGQLILNGINPFDSPPTEVVSSFPNKEELLTSMNSPAYYTVYPPIAQVIYFVSAWLSPNSIHGSIISMRIILLLAETGIILLLPKLLKKLNINPANSLWYTLNPLVIVELSGNLHFEGVVLFFFLIAIYLLVLQREKLAALAWAFASATKLIPIFFLPVIIRRYSFSKAFTFYLLFAICFIGMWIPLYNSNMAPHFLESIKLYSKTFEFNASIYYLVRTIGFEVTGYNIIQTAGPWLSRLAYLGILVILLRKKVMNWNHFFSLILFAMSWYYLLGLIVHPWYSITLVFLAVFTRFRYPMLWSFLTVLSYWAYSNPDFLENFWLIGIEYILVISFFCYEIFNQKTLSLLTKRDT